MPINQSKSSVTIINAPKVWVESFILNEDGFYMLQENGSDLILEQSILAPKVPINASKSAVTITMQSKS